MSIADIMKKIVLEVKPSPVVTFPSPIHRQNSFQYTFSEASGFDDQFKMFPRSIQQRMIAMWYDFTKKNTLRPYENFRKVLLNLAAKEL
jgi:hypothetical protein